MQHGAAPPGHDQERRLQDLERRLNDVMRVLEDMRREMRQRGPDRPQPEGGRRPSGRESREESREVIKNVEPLPEI
jgi:hypothetical protein